MVAGHLGDLSHGPERDASEATRLLHCDRSSIFIWDRERSEVVACPALGVEGNTLRLPDDVGIVGSYVHGTDGAPHVTAFRFPTIQSEIEGSLRLGVVTRALKDFEVPVGIPESTTEVDWLAGASMMVRRRVLEQVGLFDESFFLYFEETDLCRRVRRAGHRIVYVKESSVAHIGSASTGMKTWTKVPDYWFDSRRHYFLKNHGRAYLAAATAARPRGPHAMRFPPSRGR